MLRVFLEAIVILLIVRAVWKLLASISVTSGGRDKRTAHNPSRSAMLVRDPVCGTHVSPESALSDGEHFFCSEKCRTEFAHARAERRRAN